LFCHPPLSTKEKIKTVLNSFPRLLEITGKNVDPLTWQKIVSFVA
jgi:hypothetical protein